MSGRTCLICDDVAIIVIVSEALQEAPLCREHWIEFEKPGATMTRDEVCKFFEDGWRGDKPKPLPYYLVHGGLKNQTDDERGEYRTDEQETG